MVGRDHGCLGDHLACFQPGVGRRTAGFDRTDFVGDVVRDPQSGDRRRTARVDRPRIPVGPTQRYADLPAERLGITFSVNRQGNQVPLLALFGQTSELIGERHGVAVPLESLIVCHARYSISQLKGWVGLLACGRIVSERRYGAHFHHQPQASHGGGIHLNPHVFLLLQATVRRL